MATAAGIPVEPAVTETDESIEKSLSDQYQEKALVLRESVALERIHDNDTYERVCAKVIECQANIKSIEAHLEPFRAQRHAALQKIYAIKARLLGPLEEIKARGSRLIAAYQIEMEKRRKALEEAQRVDELARAKEQQEKEATTLFNEGRESEGLALLDVDPAVAPILGPRETPKVSGISKARERYKAKVENFPALIKAVAEGRVPILALMPDQKFLDKQADSMKQLLNYDGVKVEREVGLAGVRSR